MGPIENIVNQISAKVVTLLADGGYPALVDGKILIGKEHQYEQTRPPRIMFTLTGSQFDAKWVASRSGSLNASERRIQNQQRSLMTDSIEFEVRCWGIQQTSVDTLGDLEVTRALYHAVLIACRLLLPGNHHLDGSGKWTEADFSGTQLIRAGREFVFNLAIDCPVLDTLLPYAPSNVTAKLLTQMEPPSGVGSPSTGCQQ